MCRFKSYKLHISVWGSHKKDIISLHLTPEYKTTFKLLEYIVSNIQRLSNSYFSGSNLLWTISVGCSYKPRQLLGTLPVCVKQQNTSSTPTPSSSIIQSICHFQPLQKRILQKSFMSLCRNFLPGTRLSDHHQIYGNRHTTTDPLIFPHFALGLYHSSKTILVKDSKARSHFFGSPASTTHFKDNFSLYCVNCIIKGFPNTL